MHLRKFVEKIQIFFKKIGQKYRALYTKALSTFCIARAERDGPRAETRFRLSPKRTSPFKSVGASVQSTAGSRGVRISLSNVGYTTFGGVVRVLATHSIRQFPLHFPSCASPCTTRFRTSSTSDSDTCTITIQRTTMPKKGVCSFTMVTQSTFMLQYKPCYYAITSVTVANTVLCEVQTLSSLSALAFT